MQVVHAHAGKPGHGAVGQDERVDQLGVLLQVLEGRHEVSLALEQLASISAIRMA